MNEEQLEGSEPQNEDNPSAGLMRDLDNAASTLLRIANEANGGMLSIVVNDKQEQPMCGVFVSRDAELTTALKAVCDEYDAETDAELPNEGNSASIQRAKYPAKEKSENGRGESLPSEEA